MFVLLIIALLLPFYKLCCLCRTQKLSPFIVLRFQSRDDDALKNCSIEYLWKDLWVCSILNLKLVIIVVIGLIFSIWRWTRRWVIFLFFWNEVCESLEGRELHPLGVIKGNTLVLNIGVKFKIWLLRCKIHDVVPVVELLHAEQPREFLTESLCASCTHSLD